MSDILSMYDNLQKNKSNMRIAQSIEDKIIVNFVKNPMVEIVGNSKRNYKIQFIDSETSQLVYESTITPNHWVKASRQWFTAWLIRVFDIDKNVLVYEHLYNANNKRVYIHLDSKSLGDTLAWFPYVEEFRKKHNCRVICSTFWNSFFDKKYKDIKFVEPGSTVHDLYAMYEIGWFNNDDRNKNKKDPRLCYLQELSSDCLGLKYEEIVPEIYIKDKNRKIQDKYVCIATASTAQAKYWNNPGAWQKIVDYLNSLGYKVVIIQKEETDLKNVVNKTGNFPIQERMTDILNCDFFIGIGSGMSWLAWALKKPVILISGFSKPFAEFSTNVCRIINQNVCNGCFNDITVEFDKGDWNWCPKLKGTDRQFECSKQISVETVIDAINQMSNISDQKLWDDEKMWANGSEDSWDAKFGGVEKLWKESIYPKIHQYISGNVLEIAPGHGRITKYLLDELSGELFLVDLNKNCIDHCKNKFADKTNVHYFVNDGKSLDCINDDSINFVISWDSFVHMHKSVTAQYLKEISKKLVKGGYAYIHHSDFVNGQEISTGNIGGRANMSPELFKQMCEQNALEVISQDACYWTRFDNRDIRDCITIFRKSV